MSNYPQRVRLTADLTRYDPRCKRDSLGWTLPHARAQWGVMVRYDSGAILDTLWKSLVVLEEETKAEEKEQVYREFERAAVALLEIGETAEDLRRETTKIKDTWLKVKRWQAHEKRKQKKQATNQTLLDTVRKADRSHGN